MSVINIYKPSFDAFHEKPIVLWQETKGPIRVAVNMYEQYKSWLNHWTDSSRDRFAPCDAFWETHGPAIFRSLRSHDCEALIFEWEADRKVCYKWFTRTPESPVSRKKDYYSICSVTAEGARSGECRVTVTLPTDEDVSYYWHAHTMKDYLKPKPPEAT